MKKVVGFLCFSLQLLIWAASASRSTTTPHRHDHQSYAGERTWSSGAASVSESKIGSSPPRCADKCYGCTPCEPVEVPAVTYNGSGWGRRKHLRRDSGRGRGIHLQYTIYEPEGWKCQCGPSLYSP